MVGDARARAPRAGVAWAAGALIAALVWWWWVNLRVPSVFQDLTVYRRGAQAFLHGVSPYGTRAQGHGDLVFTYPPFAGVVFIPLTWMSWAAAAAALAAVSALCYVVVVLLTGRQLGWSERAIVSALVLGLAAAPLVRTVQQGQINLVLAALVAVDLWLLPRRWRGFLIGIAAGIKIVPAVFAMHLVVRRDWHGIAMVGVGGLATVATAWLIAPDASLAYWTQMALDTSRSGGGGYPDNQSLIGVLARVLRDDTPPVWMTLPLQAGALAAAYLVARKATTARQPALSVIAIAVGGLLASPVSWSHHWVWAVPMVMALVSMSKARQATFTTIVFALPPLALSPLGWLPEVSRAIWVPATCLFPLMGLAWLGAVWQHLLGPGMPSCSPTDQPEAVSAHAVPSS